MKTNKGLLQVTLNVQQENEFTRLSCSISNIGTAEIALNNTFLFVDQGVFDEKSSAYKFPFLQKKYLGIEGVADEDCIGSALCKKGDARYPISCFHIKEFYKDYVPFCNCYVLEHLSCRSILYMAPKETFSEELVLKLNKGVYRAVLMSVPKPESCDCMCCNRCFCVN